MPHRDPSASNAPAASSDPTDGNPTAALEERLRATEARLEVLATDLEGASPTSSGATRAQGRFERRLDSLAQRIHDLAQEQRRLRTDLSAVLDRVGSTASPGDSASEPSSPPTESGTRSQTSSEPANLPRKVLALGRTLARRLRPGRPRPLVHLTPEVGEPARHLPTLGVAWPDLDATDPPTLSELLGSQSHPPEAVLRARSSSNLASGGSSGTGLTERDFTIEAGDSLPDLVLQVPARGLVALTDPDVGPVPAGLCEALRLLFASEDLDFAEIALDPTSPPWVCRRRAQTQGSTPRGRNLGKVLLWHGGTTAAHHWLDDHLEIGRYRDLGDALTQPHGLRSLEDLTPPRAATQRPAILVRLTNLMAGNDHRVADLAQAVEQDRRLVVTLERPGSPLDAERRRTLEQRFSNLVVLPLADVLAASLIPSALVPLAHRHRVEHVVALNASSLASLPEALHGLPQAAPPREPTSGLPQVSAATIRFPEAPEVLRQRVRRRLGIPESATLVVQVGDLVSSQRPDSFVALARHLRDDPAFHFLLVGRGPLAGTVDDLMRYASLERLRRLSHLADDEVWAAADLACCLGDPAQAPQAVASALAAGNPVVGPAEALRPWRPVALRDADLRTPESLAQALRSLHDGPTQGLEASELAGAFSSAATADAWRRALDLPAPA